MFIDPFVDSLRDAAQFIDAQIVKYNAEARRSEDADMRGTYDAGDYVIGLGFVACQQYLTCVFAGRLIDKRAAMELGPQHACGVTYAMLVNAAANYWKHCSEWGGQDGERYRAGLTAEPLRQLGVD